MDDPPGNAILSALFSGPALTYTLGIAFIVFLLSISALISASEAAFFSLTTNDLSLCRSSNSQKDKKIPDLLANPRLLLATMFIMNTFVNVGVITLSFFLLWKMAATHLPTYLTIGLVFASTLLISLFGQIIPKAYATKNSLNIARSVGRIWKFLVPVCWPLSKPLMELNLTVEKRFKKNRFPATVEELNQAFERTSNREKTSEGEKRILKGIVNFGTITVKNIMRSRNEIHAVNRELGFSELINDVNKTGYSRVPVYRNSLDTVEGILYIKDLLPYLGEERPFDWVKLIRPCLFVPESKKIDSLLKDFQEKRVHMALAIDEYGGTTGLVTLEDVIEEILGEINDEFDEAMPLYQKIDDDTFVFDGGISLYDFCKALQIDGNTFDAIKGDSESLGGLILEIRKQLPKPGEKIEFSPFLFIIDSVDRKRIKRVNVTIQRP